MTGLVQLVPEYTGSALEFVSLGRAHATVRPWAVNVGTVYYGSWSASTGY